MTSLDAFQQAISSVERMSTEVWDVRDEHNRLRDLAPHEQKFISDVREINDRHNRYLGSAAKQYGYDSGQCRLIRAASVRQRARELIAVRDEYKAACEEAS